VRVSVRALAAAAAAAWLAPAPVAGAPDAPAPGADADAADANTVRLDHNLADDLGADDLDDLEPVGADVVFTDDELAAADVDNDTPAGGAVRLETAAMAFTRLRADVIHDPLLPAAGGSDAGGEQVFSFRAHGRAEATSRFGRRVKVKAAGRINADLGFDAERAVGVERYEALVWDTYLDLYSDHADLRLGNQIVGWGVADLLSPNDVVNPRDLRRGFAERPEDLRVPLFAASASAYVGPLSVQALYVPVAPANQFELFEGDYAVLGPNAPTAAERRVGAIVSTLADDPAAGAAFGPLLDIDRGPDHGVEHGELGGSVSLRFDDVDVHGYALWGHERNPAIAVAPALRELLARTPSDQLDAAAIAATVNDIASAGAAAIDVRYPRRLHVGAAVATRLEPFGVKAEAGYSPSTTAIVGWPGGGPLMAVPMAKPRLAATVSLDYDRGSELTVVLEGSHMRVFDIPEGLAAFQMDGDRLWLTGTRIEWSPRALPLSLRLLSFVDLTSPSYIVRPALRLSGHDNLAVEVGVGIYGGPPGSWGGAADRNDELTITVQYAL